MKQLSKEAVNDTQMQALGFQREELEDKSGYWWEKNIAVGNHGNYELSVDIYRRSISLFFHPAKGHGVSLIENEPFRFSKLKLMDEGLKCFANTIEVKEVVS